MDIHAPRCLNMGGDIIVIPALDRDAGYADSAPAREMRASQGAFKAVERELDRLIKALGVSPRPASLIELFQLLMQAEARDAHQEVTPIMKALERALEREKYFDLVPTFAREAKAAWLRDLEFAKSKEAIAFERRYLANQSAELVASYGEALSRYKKNAEWFQNASENSRASLWSNEPGSCAGDEKVDRGRTGGIRQMRVHEPTINRVRHGTRVKPLVVS
jgi:hypothetical protein